MMNRLPICFKSKSFLSVALCLFVFTGILCPGKLFAETAIYATGDNQGYVTHYELDKNTHDVTFYSSPKTPEPIAHSQNRQNPPAIDNREYTTHFFIDDDYTHYTPKKAESVTVVRHGKGITATAAIKIGDKEMAWNELLGFDYQPTESDKDINHYTLGRPGDSNMIDLLAPLLAKDDPILQKYGFGARGRDDAAQLAKMGANFIRLYYLPIQDPKEVAGVKEILNSIYEKHGIRVIIGFWAGQHAFPGMPAFPEGAKDGKEKSKAEIAALRPEIERIKPLVLESARKLVDTYSDLLGALAFDIGNEGNYHVMGGPEWSLWKRMPFDLVKYFKFMAEVGNAVKDEQRKLGIPHPVFLGFGAGMVLHTYNPNLPAGQTEMDLVAKYDKVFDGLGANLYIGGAHAGSREGDDQFRQFISLTAKAGFPVFITESGAPTNKGVAVAIDYFERILRLALETATDLPGHLLGLAAFEATDEGWKAGLGETAYGFLDENGNLKAPAFSNILLNYLARKPAP